MFIIFSPWRRLLQATMIGGAAGLVINASVYHSGPEIAWFGVIIGAVLMIGSACLAWTAARWIWAGTKIYFRGP